MAIRVVALLLGLVFLARPASTTPTTQIKQRAPYFPSIVTPTTSSYWAIDHHASVTWDASKVPSDANPIPWVQLYNTTDYGGPNFVATLASNFPAQTGKVSFVVPEVVEGSYFVMFGEYGQSSPHFTIGSIYIPFAPTVVAPDASTVWRLGSQQTVTWDTAHIPEDADNQVFVHLYKTGDFGGPEFVAILAQDIAPEQGSVNVTVPVDIIPGVSYFVMVAYWGNDSPHFTISQ